MERPLGKQRDQPGVPFYFRARWDIDYVGCLWQREVGGDEKRGGAGGLRKGLRLRHPLLPKLQGTGDFGGQGGGRAIESGQFQGNLNFLRESRK